MPSAPIAGSEALLDEASLILVGEIHGTREAPEAVLALASQALLRGPARIGLEIPTEEQWRVDRFLVDGDRAWLLGDGFWRREPQDGRSSQAMVQLLDDVRGVRQRGGDLGVFLIDADGSGEGNRRDQAMAESVERVIAAEPVAKVLVLTGNVHNRTVRGASWDAAYTPMGAFLAERHPLVSLNFECRSGTAWFMRMDDGAARAHSLHGGIDRGDQRCVVRYPQPDEHGFHGELYLADVSASPPAVGDINPA